jgi:hypothetical protein
MNRTSNRMGRHGAVVIAFVLSGCGSSQPPSAPQPAAPLAVTMDVLGGGCTAALTLATRVANPSNEPIRLNQLRLRYTTNDSRCRSHQAPIDPSLGELLGAGEAKVVHRLDPKGTVCEAPTGAFGCGWTVTADIESSQGVAAGSASFVADGPSREWSSSLPRAEIVTPGAGATISGVARVQPNYFEGCGAVITARMVVFLFRGTQVIASSTELDLGDTWALDTTRFPGGDYALGAMQNRCRVLGPLTPVSIRN